MTGVLFRDGIFFHIMVGADGGVVGPKELVGWVGTVTDGLSYTVVVYYKSKSRAKESIQKWVSV